MKRAMQCWVLILAAMILSGCGGGPAPAGNAGASPEALIGANLEMSGESAEWGVNSKRGIELARDEINAKPERKIKLKFVFEDNNSDPGKSRDAMKKLVIQDHVLAVIGSVGSNRTSAAGDVAKEEKVPLMTHASTNVTLTQNNEYVSRICYNDDFQGAVMARFALKSLKFDSAVMLEAKGNTYSEGLCRSFKKVFTDEGGKIVETLAYQAGMQDFKTLIAQLKQLNPPVVWLPGYYGEVALIIKQAREAGFQAPFLGADGWESTKLFTVCGPSIKGNYMSNHFAPEGDSPRVKQFVKAYKERFGALPDAMAALAYDAAYAMADAVSRAKELKPEALKDAINTLKGVEGVCGTINMGPDREVIKDVVVLTTGESSFIYKETIKP